MKKIRRCIYPAVGFFIITIICSSCSKTIQVHQLPKRETLPKTIKIFVFRPSIMGYAFGINIYENQKIVGRVGPRGYIEWETGANEIVLNAEGGLGGDRNLDFIKIDRQQGKTYYFKLKWKTISVRSVDLFFVQISENEARKYLSKMKEPHINIIK